MVVVVLPVPVVVSAAAAPRVHACAHASPVVMTAFRVVGDRGHDHSRNDRGNQEAFSLLGKVGEHGLHGKAGKVNEDKQGDRQPGHDLRLQHRGVEEQSISIIGPKTRNASLATGGKRPSAAMMKASVVEQRLSTSS